jgi:hypothetical protein
MIGDCPNFPVPAEEGTIAAMVGTVPLSEIILLDALNQFVITRVRFFINSLFCSPSALAAILIYPFFSLPSALAKTYHPFFSLPSAGRVGEGGFWFASMRAWGQNVGDCPDFSVPGEKDGTVPFSEDVLSLGSK